ncbi:MAG: PD-(D/E)XK nuclease family protein [Paludibacteraceae bacterium]|nr:PD-(D/E)XK nuclease family protein [Paludibacteraceae bacterium]
MRIIFSPEYSGNVYVKPADANGVMMDTVVVNTVGLINMLELRLGLHYEDKPEYVRVALYYDALSKYLADNPNNVMAASFNTSGLSTAKAMLDWRDELRSANWDFDGGEISERLDALIGVEELFRKNDGCDMAGRLHIVTDQVAFQELDCNGLTIVMAVEKSLLKPKVKELLDVLCQHGAILELAPASEECNNNLSKVRKLISEGQQEKITLNKKDDSIQIWKFEDERLACEYLSFNEMADVDVWVNADNKQMDNWMRLMGKPLTGSNTAECTPQLTQLFVMGMGMFSNSININTLIEWLNMPVHPIDRLFRTVLAETIVKKGGYRNDDCKKIIENYINGDYVFLSDDEKKLPEEEQLKIRKKEIKKRKELVSTFLPSLESSKQIETKSLSHFVEKLSSWARQKAHLMVENSDKELWAEQLLAVSGMCDAFSILLGTVNDNTVDYKTIDSWMSSVYKKGTYTNAVAECGCRTVMDSPAKIASVANKTVWIGVDGDASPHQECSFLYPSEKNGLIKGEYISPWEDETQNAYHEQIMMTPLRMTSGQLILVVRERLGGEPTLKHPLIVRLEQQIENIEDFIFRPSIGKDGRKGVEVVKHEATAEKLEFGNANKIKWPDHLSTTITDTLVEYPFDFMMEHLLNITNDDMAQMADVKTTKGNVAHAVIERLFSPCEGKRYATPEEIASRFEKEYEDVYREVVEANGAVLQLAENRLAEKLLHEQLHNCLVKLLEILKDNKLKVTECERRVGCRMGLGLPMATDNDGNVLQRDMTGVIDMTLEDSDGHPVVFDFKWTSWAKGYQDKLTENRSTQLELYRMMLGRETKDDVKRVAYFLMPEGRLYSKEDFNGTHCTQLLPSNNDNIVEQIRKSAIYRMEQIKNGVVETKGEYEELQYVKATADQGLYPLKKTDEGTQEINHFSNYGLFNN